MSFLHESESGAKSQLMLLPQIESVSSPSSNPRKAIALRASHSFWLWLSTKRGEGLVKTVNDLFFDRFCSCNLDLDMEEKLDAVCKEVTSYS